MGLTGEQILHIFKEIHAGRGNHGSFLRAFAWALICADYQNFELLRPAAEDLIDKYQLMEYLEAA